MIINLFGARSQDCDCNNKFAKRIFFWNLCYLSDNQYVNVFLLIAFQKHKENLEDQVSCWCICVICQIAKKGSKMSEDGFSDQYDETSMDLIIETLTGTSFEMRVYPNDTVLDIKNKIYRVEGIPVHHQNLLFQMKELQDFNRLSDVGIVNGSTLKLVLSMRGGPISTRRLSTCDHHIIWKDLKDLIEHTRDELGDKSGSKVSVLVFKEGEVINVIRVIENEDGSYSPYTDKTIAPPFAATQYKEKHELVRTLYKKMSEDIVMASKLQILKSKMKKMRQQRQHAKPNQPGGDATTNNNTDSASQGAGDFEVASNAATATATATGTTTTTTTTTKLPKNNRTYNKIHHINESHFDESVEIALKEKHRSRRLNNEKLRKSSDTTTSIFPSTSETTTTKSYFCENLHIFDPDKQDFDDDILATPISPFYTRLTNDGSGLLHHSSRRSSQYDEKHTILDVNDRKPESDAIEVPCAETLSLTARSRLHLTTQLIVQDTEGSGKSSPNSIELDDNAAAAEMWEIQPETIKSSGAYKLGLLKRRTSIDAETTTGGSNLDADHNGDYEVFGSRNFYHVPHHLVSTPSAIPPQYAPKDERICDLYLGSPVPETKTMHRSPLYGRSTKTSSSNIDYNILTEESSSSLMKLGGGGGNLDESAAAQLLPKIRTKSDNFRWTSCFDKDNYYSLDYDGFDVDEEEDDDVFGYYNNAATATNWNEFNKNDCSSDDAQLANEIKRLSFDLKLDDELKVKQQQQRNKIQIDTAKLDELPAVVTKKRMRCGQCNKRLNITNIYNCRCGRIFCSQHRYSESHDCKYDYKSEGRKLLQQQNPLVTATKLTKF